MLDPFPPWPFRKWLMSFFAINSSGFLSINLQTPQVNWIVYILTQAPHPYISWECKVAQPSPLPTKMPPPFATFIFYYACIKLHFVFRRGPLITTRSSIKPPPFNRKIFYYFFFLKDQCYQLVLTRTVN